jgi:hypothetical protein
VVVVVMTRRRERDESGAVAVLVALISVSLFAVAALVVDLGLARDTRRQSQNAADASALAAANVLYPPSACSAPVGSSPPCLNDAVQAAKDYARANFSVQDSEWSNCPSPLAGFVVPAGAPTCISFDSLTLPTKVWVVMPTRELKTGIGTLAGVSQVPVGSAARAVVEGGAPASCGLCFLGPIDAGNADFTVEGGSVLINGDMEGGPNGNWTATGGTIGVVGDWDGANPSPMWTHQEPFTDPWATATNVPPAVSGSVKSTPACATGGRRGTPGNGPGRYGSFAIPNEACTLDPGLYVITGAWTMGNNTDLIGSGVTLYFTCGTPAAPHVCATGEAGGSLDAKNGALHLSAPTSGSNSGLAIVYDRKNTRNLGLQGNGDTSVTGAVYAPNAMLDFNGNSCFGFSGGPVIARGVIMANGNQSCVIIHNATNTEVDTGPSEIGLDR